LSENDKSVVIIHLVKRINELENEIRELKKFLSDKSRELTETRIYMKILEREYDSRFERLEEFCFNEKQ